MENWPLDTSKQLSISPEHTILDISDSALGAPSYPEHANTDLEVEEVIISELSGNVPDVIVIYSAGINQSEKTGVWNSVAWGAAGDLGLHTGARTRLLAGVEIAKRLPSTPVVTNSFNRNSLDEPTMASVVANEIERRGVDRSRIVLEEDSFSTITQFIELLKLAEDNKWSRIAVIGNEYYKSRLTALFDNLPAIVEDTDVSGLWNRFIEKGGEVLIVNSEPILRAKSPRYARYLDEVYAQPYYKEIVTKEAQGVADIKAGKYLYKLTP